MKTLAELKHHKTAGQPSELAIRQFEPIVGRRELDKDEQKQVDEKSSRVLPTIFTSDSDSPTEKLFSPNTSMVLGGLAGAGVGGGLGAALGGSAGGMAAGGLLGMLLAGYLGRRTGQINNENIVEQIRRLPKGSRIRDLERDPITQARMERASRYPHLNGVPFSGFARSTQPDHYKLGSVAKTRDFLVNLLPSRVAGNAAKGMEANRQAGFIGGMAPVPPAGKVEKTMAALGRNPVKTNVGAGAVAAGGVAAPYYAGKASATPAAGGEPSLTDKVTSADWWNTGNSSIGGMKPWHAAAGIGALGLTGAALYKLLGKDDE